MRTSWSWSGFGAIVCFGLLLAASGVPAQDWGNGASLHRFPDWLDRPGSLPPGVKSTASWMADLADRIGHLELAQVPLPGTHDSGTYDLSYFPGLLGADAAESLRYVPRQIVEAFARAQSLTVGQQLEAGIRYLDLRACSLAASQPHWGGATDPGIKIGQVLAKYPQSPIGLHICHSLLGPAIETILDQIADFANRHPRELLILDFQHLHGMTAKQHTDLWSLLSRHFSSKLIPPGSGKTPLTDLWTRGMQIVILYDGLPAGAPQAFWNRGDAIRSKWGNAQTLGALGKALEGEIGQRDYPKFWVLQGQLTYDSGFPYSSLEEAASEVTPQVACWLFNRAGANGGTAKYPSIVIVDFPTAGLPQRYFVPRMIQIAALWGSRWDTAGGCGPGYKSDGALLCYQTCPSDFTDTGLYCAKDRHYSPGRPIRLACPSGTVEYAALCYDVPSGFHMASAGRAVDSCPDGWRDDGVTCWLDLHIYGNNCTGKCRSGYINDGCTCRRPPQTKKHETRWLTGKAMHATCEAPYLLNDLKTYCYRECPRGYQRPGYDLEYCSNHCPDKMVDIGIGGCQKHSTWRDISQCLGR